MGYWLELLTAEEIVPKHGLELLLKETTEFISILVTLSKHARGD